MEYVRIFEKGRPGVTWKNDMVNGFSLATIAESYEHEDLILTEAECETLWAAILIEDALAKKLQEIKDESDRRVALISTPEDAIKAFAKAIKLVRMEAGLKSKKEDLTAEEQAELDECKTQLDALEVDADAAAFVRNSAVLMNEAVELLEDVEAIENYLVKENQLWP